MTGIVYLDIGIGLIFVILAFSLIATSVQEVIAGILRWRSAALRQGVRRLLGDAFDEFWNDSPLIDSLRGPQFTFFATASKRDPSAIEPETFAKALLDKFGLSNMTPREMVTEIDSRLDQIEKLLDNDDRIKLEATRTRALEQVRAVVAGAGFTAREAEAAVSRWFDSSMVRVTGWYVRRTKFILFLIGLCLAGATNTDLVGYAQALRSNDALRQQMAAKGQEIAAIKDLALVQGQFSITPTGETVDDQNTAATPEATTPEQAIEEIRVLIGKLEDSVAGNTGWAHCGPAGVNWDCFRETALGSDTRPSALLGWLLLAFSVTLGAQFWFDLLKRLVAVRSGGMTLMGANKSSGSQST